MNILLVGGAGFLGLNLAKVFTNAGHQVHIADLNFAPAAVLEGIPGFSGVYPIDITNTEALLEHVKTYQIDCIVNLVSNLIPSSSYEAYNLERENFSRPILSLLDGLADRGVGYVYFSSGGTVYGSSDTLLVNEEDPKNPISYYGISKLWHEDLVLAASRAKGLRYLILRPSNPFGPMQNPLKKQGLISVVVDKMRKNQDVEIWGDGSVVRDYIWVGDLCQAIASLIEKGCWNQIYNIGSGVGYSINEVLSIIQSLLSTKSKIVYSPSRIEDVKHIVLDIHKLRSAIEFNPLELSQGIKRYIQGEDRV